MSRIYGVTILLLCAQLSFAYPGDFRTKYFVQDYQRTKKAYEAYKAAEHNKSEHDLVERAIIQPVANYMITRPNASIHDKLEALESVQFDSYRLVLSDSPCCFALQEKKYLKDQMPVEEMWKIKNCLMRQVRSPLKA